MIHRFLGKAKSVDESKLIDDWLIEGEVVHDIYKIWRDEVIFTNKGIYKIDKRGIFGKRVKTTFHTKAQIIGARFGNSWGLDFTVNVSFILRNSVDIRLRVVREDEEKVRELVKLMINEIK